MYMSSLATDSVEPEEEEAETKDLPEGEGDATEGGELSEAYGYEEGEGEEEMEESQHEEEDVESGIMITCMSWSFAKRFWY